MTKQERRIARDLAAIYLIFAFIWEGSHMAVDWGNVPQWITAGVAGSAAIIAAIGIGIQYGLAHGKRQQPAVALAAANQVAQPLQANDGLTTTHNEKPGRMGTAGG